MFTTKFGAWRSSGVWRSMAALGVLSLAACGGGYNSGGAAPAPSVTLDVQPTSIDLGASAELTWTATAGASCTATGGWSGPEPSTGVQTVTPATLGSVSYTLTCRTPSGSYSSASAAKTVALSVRPANTYSNTALVADTASALEVDARLVNPWGVALGSASTLWVANQGTNTATLYDGNGRPQPAANPRTVTLPAGTGGAAFEPTGIAANGGPDFVLHNDHATGPARFLFAGKGGSLAGWSPMVDANAAIEVYEDPEAVYTGLTIATDGPGTFLYAADFRNGRVDVFDTAFVRQLVTATRFTFDDPDAPAGYAPFGIQTLATGEAHAPQIFVAYAMRLAPDGREAAIGSGLGRIDVYDTNGQLVRTIVDGTVLDAPWGMALAPADFGALGNRLLVGNFGDGRINSFGPVTGQFAATLNDSRGTPVSVPGLRGLVFGNDVNNQPHDTLFYAAGTNNQVNGMFGRIDLGATPPVLNQPPEVVISSPVAGNVNAIVSVTATVQSSIAIAQVEFLADETVLGTATAAPYAVQWDTTSLPDGPVVLTARAVDVDGNAGTSPELAVIVANGAPAATLTQIQAQIFTPICSGCHNGSNPPGGALPGSQNLTTGNTFLNLVGVPSQEVPAVLRVKANDPANSYLIQKLEGAAGIQGSRMPLGGPFLDQAAIESVKSWIASGAGNN
jgi:uncharacterized protein (TIGR03118 family)